MSPDAASPPVPPPADAAVQLEEGVSVSPGAFRGWHAPHTARHGTPRSLHAGPKWDDRRLFGALGFHADNEDGGGCGTVVMVRPENGTVVVLWDYGAVHTYAARVEGHATNVLSVHSRPTVQRDIMLLRACLRLFERSLKSRAQDAKWVGSGVRPANPPANPQTTPPPHQLPLRRTMTSTTASAGTPVLRLHSRPTCSKRSSRHLRGALNAAAPPLCGRRVCGCSGLASTRWTCHPEQSRGRLLFCVAWPRGCWACQRRFPHRITFSSGISKTALCGDTLC